MKKTIERNHDMKAVRSILTVLLILALLLPTLVSCAGGGKKDDKKDQPDDKPIGMDISGYKIIRPDAASENVKGVTSVTRADILKYAGIELEVAIDEDTPDSAKEILIGETGRRESADALASLRKKTSKQAFIITSIGEKIVIVGLSDDDTVIAAKHFVNEFVENSKGDKRITYALGGNPIAKKTGKVLLFSENYDAVVMEKKQTVFEPSPISTEGSTYCKIIKLEHQSDPKNNGILFVTSEANSSYPLYRSKDDGSTWEILRDVPDKVNNAQTGYQPYIYELPADMGKYKKGTLLFSACTRGSGKTFMILQASTDLGESWEAICNVAIGGAYAKGPINWESEGLWEPVLMYEESTGRLYCAYSDETDTKHNQKLVYKYTTDLKSWSELGNMVALPQADYRPGMIALTKMGNKYALAYEIHAFNPGGQIHLAFADSLDSWNYSVRGTPIKDKDTGMYMCTAPGLGWTSDGNAAHGTLFATASRNSDQTKMDTKCALFISFDGGRTFTAIENPLGVTKPSTGSDGYSPGFFTDKDGYVYYVNNREYIKGLNCKIELAKIKVY